MPSIQNKKNLFSGNISSVHAKLLMTTTASQNHKTKTHYLFYFYYNFIRHFIIIFLFRYIIENIGANDIPNLKILNTQSAAKCFTKKEKIYLKIEKNGLFTPDESQSQFCMLKKIVFFAYFSFVALFINMLAILISVNIKM